MESIVTDTPVIVEARRAFESAQTLAARAHDVLMDSLVRLDATDQQDKRMAFEAAEAALVDARWKLWNALTMARSAELHARMLAQAEAERLAQAEALAAEQAQAETA